ncbi:hypothetical protein ACFXJ5_09260 [Streptomyces sp. NPDC059373]
MTTTPPPHTEPISDTNPAARSVTAVLGSYDTCDPGTGATDFDAFSDGDSGTTRP